MPSRIEPGSSKFFRVACFLLRCQRRCFRGIEADNNHVVVAAWLERHAAQAGDRLVKTERAQTRTFEVHELKNHRLVTEIGSKRYGLPGFVPEDQIQRDRRIQLLLNVDALGYGGPRVLCRKLEGA